MGSAESKGVQFSCCSAGEDAVLEFGTPASKGRALQHSPSVLAFAAEVEQEGVPVTLLLQDKETWTRGTVKLDRGLAALVLWCDDRVRAIPLMSLSEVLCSGAELSNIRWSSSVSESHLSTCAALHLIPADSCLPIFFESPKHRDYFVDLVRPLLVGGQ